MQPSAPSRATDQDHEEKNELRDRMVRLIDALLPEFVQMKKLDTFGNNTIGRFRHVHALPKKAIKREISGNSFRIRRQDVKNLDVLDSALKVVATTYLLQSRLGTPREVICPPSPSAPSPQNDELHFLAQKLVDETPIRRVDPLVERLQERTVQAVLNGTAWHSAKDVGARADPNAANLHALASRLLKERRVFAIERTGVKEYPDYAFDPLGNPIPAIREVLGILSSYSPFRLASWFESTNAHLGGRRPREVLGTEPQAVISAARAHTEGPMHG